MFARHTLILGLALVFGAGNARAQAGQSTRGGSVARSLTSLVATHDDLAVRFRRLASAAINAHSTATERAALGRFVRAEILSRLTVEASVLYPAFDSIIGGGYAVPATLFDLDGIWFLVKEIERTASASDRIEFVSRAYALSTALETYFTKTQLLVLPVLEQRLNAAGLNAVVTRLEQPNTP